jgi:hypothetical protein
MANREHEYRSWQERQRGGRYGDYVDTDEGDSSVRAGSFDEGRERQGGSFERERRLGGQRSSGRGFAGYGDFGQGDYDQPSRGANTGQNRYGQTGYGPSGYGAGGYGAGNYGQGGGDRGDPGYGRRSWPGEEGSRGRDWGSSARGDYELQGRNWGRHWGPGSEGSHDRSQYGHGGGEWQEPYGEGQQYGGGREYGTQGGQGPGLHRGKGPKNYQRSDERIKELLCERLHEDPNIDASEVTVNVQGGRITLEGTVEDRRTKNAIEDVAEQCGTQEVHNNLRVQRTGFGTSSSATTATQQAGRTALSGDDGESSKLKRN